MRVSNSNNGITRHNKKTLKVSDTPMLLLPAIEEMNDELEGSINSVII